MLAAAAGTPAAAATSAAPEAASQVRREIDLLEADIKAAYSSNALPRYFSYFADDFRALFPEGMMSLPEYRKQWGDFIERGGAIVAFTYTELQVQVAPAGDAAIASYRAVVSTKYPGKDPSIERYLETDVFFKRAGRWKLVEMHQSADPVLPGSP
jgi:ketosteroid isomerase-like protein